MRSSSLETLIGAFVILAAAGFLLFAYGNSSRGNGGGGYKLTADFDNVDGVNVGSDVRMAGIKIGTVISQKLNPENFQAQLVLSVDPSIKLTDDTTAKVSAEGLLGSKFIALEPGGSETVLADGGVISMTQGAVDIWSLISQAMFERGSSGGRPAASPPADFSKSSTP